MTQEKNENSFTFSFEKLEIWHHAVDLADCTLNIVDALPSNKHLNLTTLMKEAVSRVAQNIAEGKGKQYKKDFIQSLHSAEGSLFEFLTVTELLKRRGCIGKGDEIEIRKQAEIIDRKLHGLINSLRKQ
jgi:four helix bundle protein